MIQQTHPRVTMQSDYLFHAEEEEEEEDVLKTPPTTKSF